MGSTLIIAANSGIGRAICQSIKQGGKTVLTVSRDTRCDYSDAHFQAELTDSTSVNLLRDWLGQVGVPDQIIHCAGTLHNESYSPEKQLSQLQAEWLFHSMTVNVLTHVHAAQAVSPLLNRKHAVHWASLSAMVGSISDNYLGGWHSYRMSKAALNMFIRNLDIEWRRKNNNNRVVAIHPGTTDTQLSKPFQAGIADGKLYSAEQTAERILTIMETLKEAQSGRLLHWDGRVLEW